jgi:hypothetical protein
VGTAVGIIATVLRGRSSSRLRDAIARDIELHNGLPEDAAAREKLAALLVFETERLDSRVRHGRVLRGWQLGLVVSAALSIYGAGLKYLVILDRQSDDPGGIAARTYETGSDLLIGLAAALLGLSVANGFAHWVGSKIDVIRPDWRDGVDDALRAVRLGRLVPRHRRDSAVAEDEVHARSEGKTPSCPNES